MVENSSKEVNQASVNIKLEKHNKHFSKVKNKETKPLGESIPTRNSHLEGKKHPVTRIPYEKDKVVVEGKVKEGVFPRFSSELDVQLPEQLHKADKQKQIEHCNSKLKEKIKNNPSFAKKFTLEQREMIEKGFTPKGYTWHHHQTTGKMQLVDSVKHAVTGHTGGSSIWCDNKNKS